MSSLQELNWILYWPCTVQHCVWENLIRWEGLGSQSVPSLFVTNMLFRQISVFFAPSQQPFPCMAGSLHGSGHCAVWILWRISATSLRQLFLDEVNQDSRVQHLPKCRCHNFLEYITSLRVLSLSFASSLSGPRGIAKPENTLWKFIGQFENVSP